MTENLQPLIDYAKTEYIRLLIEVDKSGYIVLYCDKTEKRNFLAQIRLNNIKTRIKIVTYDYDIRFPEIPTLTNLDYLAGKIKKTFRKERTISYYPFILHDKKWRVAFVDFPNAVKKEAMGKMEKVLDSYEYYNFPFKIDGYNVVQNQDRNTLVLYYMGDKK